MDNKTTSLLVIALGVIIVAGASLFFLQKDKQAATDADSMVVQIQAGITVLTPKANEGITSGVKITGSINGDGWDGFEGQVGTVTLLGGDGKELATAVLPATSQWTVLPANFETTLQFTAPSKTSGYLVFKNENASGQAIKDKTFILPVKFK